MKELTLLVTTYNRKERLLNMLRSIERQGLFDNYSVLISDNHSDYDVSEFLSNELSSEFLSVITVHTWSFNIRMSSNISVSLALVQTPWCLFLSDDDEMTPDSLAVILDDINKNPNAIALKYSLLGYTPYPDTEFLTLQDFISYYENNIDKAKEMYYLSRVYNLRLLGDYCGYFTEYSYTYISFLVPLFFALRDRIGYVKTSSFSTIEYKMCPSNENWFFNERYVKTELGISTVSDILLNNDSFEEKDRLMAIVFSYIEMSHLAKCLHLVHPNDRYIFFVKIYRVYKYHKKYLRIVPNFLYYNYLGILLLKKKIKNSLKTLFYS